MVEGHSVRNRSSVERILSSDVLLGTLIGVLSILTAVASYQSSLASSDESDANVQAQAILADSNAEYLRANQAIIYDYSMYDGFFLYDGEDDVRADYYRASFSEALDVAIELDEEDPFSDTYYEEMLEDADRTYAEAFGQFEEAQVSSKKANDLQMSMLIMAVGLSLSAWASLLPDVSRLRPTFVMFAILALFAGLVNLATTL